MSMVAIRAEIATIISGVAGTGNVFEYDRVTVPPEDMATVFQSSGIINAAFVTSAGFRRRYQTNEQELITRFFELVFLYEHNDPATSGLTFQALIETIADALGDDPTLSGTCLTLGDSEREEDYLTMEKPEILDFGEGIERVHAATMRMTVQEQVDYA